MKILAKIKCFFFNHDWDLVDAIWLEDKIVVTVCKRCDRADILLRNRYKAQPR